MNLFFSRVTNDELRKSCKQLQNRTTNILLGNSIYTHVATFGNTLVKDAGDWVPILGLQNQPKLLVGVFFFFFLFIYLFIFTSFRKV